MTDKETERAFLITQRLSTEATTSIIESCFSAQLTWSDVLMCAEKVIVLTAVASAMHSDEDTETLARDLIDVLCVHAKERIEGMFAHPPIVPEGRVN